MGGEARATLLVTSMWNDRLTFVFWLRNQIEWNFLNLEGTKELLVCTGTRRILPCTKAQCRRS